MQKMEILINIIREQKVMLDADLAKIYGYETKSFNQQIKRNTEKFDNDFMFRLTLYEVLRLRSQNVTANVNSMSKSVKKSIFHLISPQFL